MQPQAEQSLVDMVLALFKTRLKGCEHAEQTSTILAYLSIAGCETSPQTLRAAIGHIRREDLLAPGYILSDINAGYWLSDDKAEMSAFLDKQLNRMTNQFQNIKLLHQRIRYAKDDSPQLQTKLF